MGIHLEISGELNLTEWQAATAFIAALRPASTQAIAALVKDIPTASLIETVSVPIVASLIKTQHAPEPPALELDAKGVAWNAAVHTSTRAKNADGSWRAKRNVDPALLLSVTAAPAELSAAPQSPIAAPLAPPPPVAPPSPEAAAAPAPAPAVEAGLNYASVMRAMILAQKANALSTQDVADACTALQIADVRELSGRPDLFEPFLLALGIAVS